MERTITAALLALSVSMATMASVAPAFGAEPETGKDPNHPTEVAKERARALHRDGAALFVAGKYEQALAAFTAAWALVHHPDLAGNLSACEAELGRYRDAAEHAQYVLDDPTSSAKLREGAKVRMREVAPHIVTVRVVTSEPLATVTIDGRPVSADALRGPIYLDPGEHRFEAREGAMTEAHTVIRLAAGANETVSLTLRPVASAVAPPPAPPAQPPGPVTPGAERGMERGTLVLLGGGATVVVAAGLGAVLTVVANGSASDADDALVDLGAPAGARTCAAAPQLCERIAEGRGDADTLGNAAVVAFAAAGAAAVGTALLYVWWEDTPPATAVRVGGMVTDHGASVTLGTDF